MRSNMKITETPYALLVESSQDGSRLVRIDGSYFEPPAAVFEKLLKENTVTEERVIEDSPVLLVGSLFLIMSSFAVYFFTQRFRVVDEGFAIAMFILLVNVVIHEAFHAIALKVLCPEAKISCGFKMMFVFPAFYVDTSDSYLLPPCKRMTVYLAGIVGNAVFVLLTVILAPSFARYDYLVISTLLMNLVPIMRGDGYYILMTLKKKRGREVSRKAAFWRDFARGIVMFVLLLGISFLSNQVMG